MYNYQEVANWFLDKGNITPKKLQKLVYYAYSWYLTLMNESANDLNDFLFKEKFQAWVHGPVLPDLYFKYRGYGFSYIQPSLEQDVSFDYDTEQILEQVWEVYGGYTGNELESISHQEKPWQEARGDCHPTELCRTELSDEVIFNYYIQQATE